MITRIEDYFTDGCGRCERFSTPDCSTRKWHQGLLALRRLCLQAKLIETLKWGHPCYMYADRNIVIIGALKGDFRLSFFDAALMKDRDRVLEKQGPNTQYPDMFRFTACSQVGEKESLVVAYIEEAMGYAASGMKAPKSKVELELPEELVEAMNCDPELAAAFQSLTPGRRKGYIINLQGAKRPATRMARISKFREKILQGKGPMER